MDGLEAVAILSQKKNGKQWHDLDHELFGSEASFLSYGQSEHCQDENAEVPGANLTPIRHIQCRGGLADANLCILSAQFRSPRLRVILLAIFFPLELETAMSF